MIIFGEPCRDMLLCAQCVVFMGYKNQWLYKEKLF